MVIQRFTRYIYILYIKIYLVGTVCAQNATEIIVEFSCPEAGSSGLCTGYVKGNCNCKIVPTLLPTGNVIPTSINQPCTDGNQLCSEQCNCEGNYYECVNHAWEARQLPCIFYLFNFI